MALKRTPVLPKTPVAMDSLSTDERNILDAVKPLRDNPDTMIKALDALLAYYLETPKAAPIAL